MRRAVADVYRGMGRPRRDRTFEVRPAIWWEVRLS